MSIKGRKIDIGDISFNVLVDGEGPDVLLVHGFPDSNSVWRHQIPVLVNAGFRVIAPDLRGFGETTAPRKKNDYKINRARRGSDEDPRRARCTDRAPRRARLGGRRRLADLYPTRRSD